ncbi:MAG TPA: hypothetical protein PK239_00145 [Chitinophagales bacterium]|nr:hypothetical protein [Chitinophagales bacterium]HRK25671.1 hypothetical protein [Chitinophagales bacterium]
MKTIILFVFAFLCAHICAAQPLPPKQAYPLNSKQIHSGHSLTDPLFYPHWPGQYVNLIANVNSLAAWQLFDAMVGKSTTPGSSMKHRWDTPIGFGSPDARLHIANWELLSITERVPLYYEGGNTQQWYLDGIQEQKQYLSLFVNNAWNNGNNGNGTPTLLWTTWTNLDGSNGPWRQMLDTQGEEFERMQDYANANRPSGAPPVYIIPGHKMMARLYDDIQLGLVPGITNINQFFGDNIHTNELGAYAISMMHYACIFNQSPVGLPNNLLPDAPTGTPIPSPALALYLQTMIWNVVTTYPRTGITIPTCNPVITGNSTACANAPATYSVPAITGATYVWTVTGGTILSGQGAHQITVQWNNGTAGTVNVEQTVP